MPKRQNNGRRRGVHRESHSTSKNAGVSTDREEATVAVRSHRASKKRKIATAPSKGAVKNEPNESNNEASSCVAATPDVSSPPELKVMVSDSELWMIRERNKQNGIVDSTRVSNAGSYVVVTEVSNDGALVAFKECYSPFGFFEHCCNSGGGGGAAAAESGVKEWGPFRTEFIV